MGALFILNSCLAVGIGACGGSQANQRGYSIYVQSPKRFESSASTILCIVKSDK